MSETLSSPAPSEVEQEADRLRARHKAHSESLESFEANYQRAQELRDAISESDDPEADFSYEDRAFANGEFTQREMVAHSKLHYNANMWEAQEHYRANKDEYVDMARRDAAEAGVDITPSTEDE